MPTASPPRLPRRPHAAPTRLEKERATGADLTANDPPQIGPWILGDMIGKGSSGRVKLGKHMLSGKIAAIKIISKNPVLTSKATLAEMAAKHQRILQGIHREIVIMKLINHPCIMSLYDLQETETEFYLALEYVEGGELFDYLTSRGRLAESEVLYYFKQILYGLDYCHRFNISHRDLKPENILLDRNMNVKIADFGMAALEVANGMLQTSCGSPHYASPEIVAGKAYHGSSSDIWSCGVVLYALLSGRLPFDDPDIRTLLQKVMIGVYDMDRRISPVAQDLIARMLVVDPARRLTIRQIFRHPFMRGPTGRIFVNPRPPSLDELSKPIGPNERIETAYLHHLVILFHKRRSDIERALAAQEPNWEKAFLYLLRQYAERVRENYGEDDVDAKFCPPTTRPRRAFADITHANITHANGLDVAKTRAAPRECVPVAPVGQGQVSAPRHLRENTWTRPRSVVGPRPNPPVPRHVQPGPRVAGSHVAGSQVASSGMRRLDPTAKAFLPDPRPVASIVPDESALEDVGSPPVPFRSILSPDIDGSFAGYVHVAKRWSDLAEGSNADAPRSTLSPHAEPFILGSFGQPHAKAKKGRPTPLNLEPNWQPVSSLQPDMPGEAQSPRLGHQPKVTGWFTNLFTFRPVSHVLYSTASIEMTGRECARVLGSFGIQVVEDGHDVLRCSVERFVDYDKVLITKPAKFRVEVKSHSRIVDSPRLDGMSRLAGDAMASPYPCVLVMTQEKGAHSTLKAVYARLRATWRLDALVSPVPVPVARGLQTPMLG